MSSNPLPTAASEGFSDASSYDAHRPSYPSEAVDTVLKKLRIAGQNDAKVVEIASGTGKFTELLARRPESYDVVAVEPHKDMRQQLEAKNLPKVKSLDGHAGKMPLDDEWGDACIAAQAFHWFATPDSLREINRVLRPGAVFGAIWNVEDYNKPKGWQASTAWEQKLNDLIWSFDDGHPRFRHQKWKEVFDNELPINPIQAVKDIIKQDFPKFSVPIGEESVKWTVWLSEEALWSRFNTLSQIAILKGAERDAAVKTFKEALQGNDVEKNGKGEIALHGVTYFMWTDRM